MPIETKYERIKREHGDEAAREYMRSIRKNVKNYSGGSFNNKAFAKEASKKGVAAREAKLRKQKRES